MYEQVKIAFIFVQQNVSPFLNPDTLQMFVLAYDL